MLEYSSNLLSFANALTPKTSHDFLVSSSRSLFCPVRNKLQPSFASRLAMAAPMPELAPVTSAYLSLKLIIVIYMLSTLVETHGRVSFYDMFDFSRHKNMIIFKNVVENDKIFY